MNYNSTYKELENRIAELERQNEILKLSEKYDKISAAKYRKMIDSIGDVIVIIDGKGLNKYKSPNIEKYFGWKPEDVIGKGALENVHSEDLEFAQKFIGTLMSEPNVMKTIELRYKCKDGSYKWIEFTCTNLFNDPDINGLLGNYSDITGRKLAEEKLIQSEVTVRNKLKTITHPKGEITKLELSDIIDTEVLQSMMEDFYQLTGMLGAVLDVYGKVLVAVGWQDICTKFHRCNPGTLKNCIESDTILPIDVPEGTFKSYHCKNNMWDIVTPIIVGGKHVGNVFMGQYFLEGEEPDYEFFRKQAQKYGFNEKEYLEALDRVPRFSKETVDAGMQFYSKLAGIISTLSYSSIQQSRMLVKHQQAEAAIKNKNQEYEVINEKLIQTNEKLFISKNKAEESEGKLKAALESMTDAIFISDQKGNFIDFNEAFATFHKFKNKVECAKTLKQFPVFLDVFNSNGEFVPLGMWVVSRALRGETGLNEEYVLKRKDTEETWVGSYNYSPIRNTEGDIIGSVVTARDITDLKKSQKEINIAKERAEESEERFNLAMAASKDGLYDWNLETNEIYYSPGWKSMLGYKDDELPNNISVWEKLTLPEDVAKTQEIHKEELIKKKRDRFELEFKMQHKDGYWVDILSRSEAFFDKKGKAVRMVGTHVDITERKREEKILDIELKLFEYAINHSEEELLRKFLDEAEKLTGSEIGFYHYIEDDQESISLQTWSSNTLNNMCKESGEVTRHYPISKAGVWIDCIKERKPVIHNDYSSLANKKGLHEGHTPVIREIVVPVIRGNQIKAVLGVGNKKSDYSEADVESVQRLADVAWETTVRKQVEENLKNTFNLSPSIICKANLNTGYFIEANQAVTRVLGYSVEEFTSMPFIKLIHPDDQQKSTDEKEEQIKGKEVTFFENRYLCKDGSYKWMAWHGTKADENGIVTAIGSDINERKIVEQEIVETKLFYENIIEGVQDGIWVTNENDIIFYANSAMEKIAGVAREKIQGNNVLKDFPVETTKEFIKYYKKAKKAKKPVWYVVKVTTPAGRNSWQNGWLIP